MPSYQSRSSPLPGSTGQPDLDLRVGDLERDACLVELREGYAAGRLSDTELHRRVEVALRAGTHRDLAALVADLPAPAVRRTRAGWNRGKVAVGAAGLLLALFAGVGLSASGGTDTVSAMRDPNDAEDVVVCDTTGLEMPTDLGCPPPSKPQQQIMAAAESAEAAAEQAFWAAENSPGDEKVRELADRAEAAAARTRRAVSDARVIVATAPDQQPARGALDQALRSAQLAARDAARAAVDAEALEGEALEEEG